MLPFPDILCLISDKVRRAFVLVSQAGVSPDPAGLQLFHGPGGNSFLTFAAALRWIVGGADFEAGNLEACAVSLGEGMLPISSADACSIGEHLKTCLFCKTIR